MSFEWNRAVGFFKIGMRQCIIFVRKASQFMSRFYFLMRNMIGSCLDCPILDVVCRFSQGFGGQEVRVLSSRLCGLQ